MTDQDLITLWFSTQYELTHPLYLREWQHGYYVQAVTGLTPHGKTHNFQVEKTTLTLYTADFAGPPFETVKIARQNPTWKEFVRTELGHPNLYSS